MINLHLLTKISGFDSTYRNQITSLISSQAMNVSAQVLEMLQAKRWAYCQVTLEKYIHDIQPYCQPSFITTLLEDLDGFTKAEAPELKEMICKHILNSIQNNLVQIINVGHDKA